MNPDVFSGPARRLTPEEWAVKVFGDRRAGLVGLVDTGALLVKIHGDPRLGVVDHVNRQAYERRAQGGRG